MTASIPNTALPTPAQSSGVLLFGGTFDPVHRGHIELGFMARDLAVPGGQLIFVPASISPHKAVRPTPGHHRARMIQIACQGRDRWSVWTEELDRADRIGGGDGNGGSGGASYWVDTLETAAATCSDLSFLIGADQALAFNRWHEWRRILELAQPVLIGRDSVSTTDQLGESLAEQGWGTQDAALFLDRSVVLDTPTMDINATSLRERLATDHADPITGLDPRVQEYAQQQGLYRESAE